jgi:bud site selection protein 31
MSFRRRLKNKRVPEGFEMIEDVIDDFEQQMRDAVNESHEGKRKNETTWKIHRLHWEKNRFIYDLMYVRKVISRELVRIVEWRIEWFP